MVSMCRRRGSVLTSCMRRCARTESTRVCMCHRYKEQAYLGLDQEADEDQQLVSRRHVESPILRNGARLVRQEV
jgi:hypothetical protein